MKKSPSQEISRRITATVVEWASSPSGGEQPTETKGDPRLEVKPLEVNVVQIGELMSLEPGDIGGQVTTAIAFAVRGELVYVTFQTEIGDDGETVAKLTIMADGKNADLSIPTGDTSYLEGVAAGLRERDALNQ